MQWINNKIEVVHADASAYIALIDATTDWQHESVQCLSGKDLTGFDFLSITKDGFVPISVQSTSEAWLSNVVFQKACKRILSGYVIAQSNIGLLRMICAEL
jgi:hypothetical protein